MANLYVWFETIEQRRSFLRTLLEHLETTFHETRNERGQNSADWQSAVDTLLRDFDAGRNSSPYYQLYRLFYRGTTWEENSPPATTPWDSASVFAQGFRQIYTQKFYQYRRGYWLVFDFRSTGAGWEMRRWIEQRVPANHIGMEVRVLPEDQLRQRLRQWQLQWTDLLSLAGIRNMAGQLQAIYDEDPTVFRGKRVYAWERLAFAFFKQGALEEAVLCLHRHASLRPKSAEPYVNLGTFLISARLPTDAISALHRGLELAPKDEFLAYNLAIAYQAQGDIGKAQFWANETILRNPFRGVNYKVKADLHRYLGQWESAISHYQYAVNCMTPEDPKSLRAICYNAIAECLAELGRFAEARRMKRKAMENEIHEDRQLELFV